MDVAKIWGFARVSYLFSENLKGFHMAWNFHGMSATFDSYFFFYLKTQAVVVVDDQACREPSNTGVRLNLSPFLAKGESSLTL